MDLLGPSLWDRWNKEGQKMPEQLVACIAVEALTILECLHTKGCGLLLNQRSFSALSWQHGKEGAGKVCEMAAECQIDSKM